jgi:hypothetical protein
MAAPPPPQPTRSMASASLLRPAVQSSPARSLGGKKRAEPAGSADQLAGRIPLDWLPPDRQNWFTVSRCPDILKHSQQSHQSYLV